MTEENNTLSSQVPADGLNNDSSGTTVVLERENNRASYETLSHSELIARIWTLEAQLQKQVHETAALAKANQNTAIGVHPPSHISAADTRVSKKEKRTQSKTFDASRYSTRFIALKFSYLGQRYNGYEHANGSAPPPRPTIEEVLWKALRKARLISPPLEDGTDHTFDVVWGSRQRAEVYGSGQHEEKAHTNHETGAVKVRLELNWDRCQYSKCGRTDRGVSAFGQVIGIRVRSRRPLEKPSEPQNTDSGGQGIDSIASNPARSNALTGDLERPQAESDVTDTNTKPISFDDVQDELPYVSILNAVLPPDIRVLAWCPNPPPDFDARFSCRERRYKYFFTNPAFCPTPGPLGLQFGDGRPSELREGWLDIAKMREAAKKLEGLHDFRNLCKIDPSKQMPSCERRITFADIEPFDDAGSALGQMSDMAAMSDNATALTDDTGASRKPREPRTYAFAVHGSAFLWHQVRCMVAILCLVGQGLEEPDIIDKLLDIKSNPRRPMYEMAEDAPLVLWDCIFPGVANREYSNDPLSDSLDWMYAGDARMMQGLATKSDGKFGLGGVADAMWTQWRYARINEVITGGLFDLVLRQGDASALQRGGVRDSTSATVRSQKIFDGDDNAKIVGRYVPVLQKPKLDSLEKQNAKYAAGRGLRRETKQSTGDPLDD